MKKFSIFRKFYTFVVNAVGVDRIAHAVVCAFLALFGAMAAAKGTEHLPTATLAAVGMALAMAVGLIKEWADGGTEGDFFDWGDLAADFIGCVLGGAAAWWLLPA